MNQPETDQVSQPYSEEQRMNNKFYDTDHQSDPAQIEDSKEESKV